MILLPLWTAACAPLLEKPADLAWPAVYQPIEDVEAERFLTVGVAMLTRLHGPPEIPIRKVLIRHSVKADSARQYRVATGFSRMELIDRDEGVFCIYVAVPPSHERFYYLLGHEIGHLRRPELIGSPAEERFCNDFARRLCAREHKPWNESWETRDWVRRAFAVEAAAAPSGGN